MFDSAMVMIGLLMILIQAILTQFPDNTQNLYFVWVVITVLINVYHAVIFFAYLTAFGFYWCKTYNKLYTRVVFQILFLLAFVADVVVHRLNVNAG